MKRSMIAWLLGAQVLVAGEDLKTLLDAAAKNDLVASYEQRHNAAQYAYESAKSSYLPRINLGGGATFVDERGSIDVGETYTGYARARYTLFDGFKRENIFDERDSERKASESDLKGYKKSLSLEVTRNYFNLLDLLGDIDAQEQKRKQLREQLERQKRFYDARIATEEEVERIRAAVANADFEIEQLRYDVDAVSSELKNLTGMSVETPEPGSIEAPVYGDVFEPDAIQAMKHRAEALEFNAMQSISTYYPTIRVEDTYSFYDYNNMDTSFPIDRVRKQNKLMFVAEMTIVDFYAASEQAEATRAQMLAIRSEVNYERKRADANVKLARRAIERSKTLIKAAELSLSASDKTLASIELKYKAHVVDYVKYLDALTQKTDALSQYNRAKNTLQLAYANYYFYAGYDLKEYVR